jgi:hypothetical protein
MSTQTTKYNLDKQASGENPGTWDILLNSNFDKIAAALDALDTGGMKKTGGTFTGQVLLSGDPVALLQAATKNYVDTKTATLTNATAGQFANTIVKRDVNANFSANMITANLTGNVTGNVSGSAGSCTGNAATATRLATAHMIDGVAFDGTADITLHTKVSAVENYTKVLRGTVKFIGATAPTVISGGGSFTMTRLETGGFQINISNSLFTAPPTGIFQLSAYKDGVSPFNTSDILATKDYQAVYLPNNQNNSVSVWTINSAGNSIVDLQNVYMSFILLGY